jgi:ribosome biogenesis protein Tsr3
MNVLVDGLYIIRWSVSPNNIVFVEYNHLRIATFMVTYQKILCHLSVSDCEPNKETTEKIERLQFIKTLVDAAKAKVEVSHNPGKGLTIYNYARTLLNKMGKYYNCSC